MPYPHLPRFVRSKDQRCVRVNDGTSSGPVRPRAARPELGRSSDHPFDRCSVRRSVDGADEPASAAGRRRPRARGGVTDVPPAAERSRGDRAAVIYGQITSSNRHGGRSLVPTGYIEVASPRATAAAAAAAAATRVVLESVIERR